MKNVECEEKNVKYGKNFNTEKSILNKEKRNTRAKWSEESKKKKKSVKEQKSVDKSTNEKIAVCTEPQRKSIITTFKTLKKFFRNGWP